MMPCTKIQIHSFHDNLVFKQICDWKRLCWKGWGDKLFQPRFCFLCLLPGCQKFQISSSEKCCCVIFLPRDRASKPFCKESSLQARFFVRDDLFQDSLC
jgi:hypothetical protein